MAPSIIFGTASFGMDKTEFQGKTDITALLQALEDEGIHRLDTGARYPPLNPGRSEELIGECKEQNARFLIDTKVYTDTKADGSGDLTPDAIERSVRGSLSRLGRETSGVNVLHIHRADPSTPVLDQLRAFNDQIQQGHCKTWGVSNVPMTMLEEMFRICDEQGFQKPSCYQGEYNIITRGTETKLLPLLRANGVAFNAFRPLASGFMTGNFVNGTHAGTRFADDNPLGKFAQKLFSAEDLHTAMKQFEDKVASQGATLVEIAIRWLYFHSALGDGDGVVLGASKTSQVKEVTAMLQKGSLSEELVEAANRLWDGVKQTRGEIL